MTAFPMCSVAASDCPLSSHCYRHRESGTQPSERQSWMYCEPEEEDDEGDFYCSFFIHVQRMEDQP